MNRHDYVCFCSHPTRPTSAMSLRSSRTCLAWPLLGSNAEYMEPPSPPFATIRRSPSKFRSPWREKGGKEYMRPILYCVISLLFHYHFITGDRYSAITLYHWLIWYYKRCLTYQVFFHHHWSLWYQQEPRSPCLSPSLLSVLGHCQ